MKRSILLPEDIPLEPMQSGESGQPASDVDNESTQAAASDQNVNPIAPPDLPRPKSSKATITIATIIVFYLMYLTKAATFPLVLSVLVALPMRPVVRFLNRQLKFPKFLGALLSVSVLVGLLVATIFWVAGPAKSWMMDAPESFRKAERKMADIFASVEDIKTASEELEKITSGNGDGQSTQPTSESVDKPVPVEVKPPSFTSIVLDTTGNVVAGMVIAVSMVFMLLAFGDNFQRAAVGLLETRMDRWNAENMVAEIEKTISRYLFIYTLINVVLGCTIGTLLWLLGMPNPILWGVMAGLLNYIPFVGLLVGTVVVALVAVVTFDSIAFAMLAPAIYLGVNGIEANLITPCILGRGMRLNVILIFVSIVIGGWMWGVGGAIIAVPILAAAKIVCDHHEPLHNFGVLLGAPD